MDSRRSIPADMPISTVPTSLTTSADSYYWSLKPHDRKALFHQNNNKRKSKKKGKKKREILFKILIGGGGKIMGKALSICDRRFQYLEWAEDEAKVGSGYFVHCRQNPKESFWQKHADFCGESFLDLQIRTSFCNGPDRLFSTCVRPFIWNRIL